MNDSEPPWQSQKTHRKVAGAFVVPAQGTIQRLIRDDLLINLIEKIEMTSMMLHSENGDDPSEWGAAKCQSS
jgi:hypothetical protein